jgi:hypothetical protein
LVLGRKPFGAAIKKKKQDSYESMLGEGKTVLSLKGEEILLGGILSYFSLGVTHFVPFSTISDSPHSHGYLANAPPVSLLRVEDGLNPKIHQD